MNFLLKSWSLLAMMLMGMSAQAQNVETLSPSADAWVRTDNAGQKKGSDTKMEVKNYVTEEKDIKFYGIVSFTLNKPEGYVVKSAQLRLTSERIKTGRATHLYLMEGSIDEENVNYTAVESAITAALATIPATFNAEGQNGKSVALDAITAEKYMTISGWQNTIDVTALAKNMGKDATILTILIASGTSSDSNNNSNCFFTKEQAAAISEARTKEAIATLKLAGQNGKAVTDNGVTMNAVADWTNMTDLTSYVKSLDGTTLNLMIVNPANTKTSVKVYTKEATDVTLKDETVFAAADLVPQLTVIYKKKGGESSIITIETMATRHHHGIYTLSGQRVEKMGRGIYIVNGKKVLNK